MEVRKLSLNKVIATGAILSGLGMMSAGVAEPVQSDVYNIPHSEGQNKPIIHLRELPFRIKMHNVDYVSDYIKKKETTYYEHISREKLIAPKQNSTISKNILQRYPAEPLLQGSKSIRPNKKQTVSIASLDTKKQEQQQQPSFSHPVTNPSLTSKFGMRKGHHHNGIDVVSSSKNMDIRAAKTGKVVASSWHSSGLGNLVIIDHGNGFETYYGHLSKRYVVEGDIVRAGDVIGKMGNTGHSTGVHLHFEIRQNNRPLNPLAYLNQSS